MLAVGLATHAAGVIVAVLISPLIESSPSPGDLGWGAAAGVAGGLAILALLRGFANGDMAVVSPIAAVGAAGWPVLYSVATGDVPTALQSGGLVVGIIAIWTISGSSGSGRTRAEIRTAARLGVLAGVGFGGLLIMLSFVGNDAGIWPLVPARVAGGIALLAIGATQGTRLIPTAASLPALVASGGLTILGNGAFILAANRGSLAVVAVLTAMFPAATVVLARFVVGELLGKRRRVGLGLALAAVALVAAG